MSNDEQTDGGGQSDAAAPPKPLAIGDKGIYHPLNANFVYDCVVTRARENQVDLECTVDGEPYAAVNIPIKHSLADAIKSDKRWFVRGVTRERYNRLTQPEDQQAPPSNPSSPSGQQQSTSSEASEKSDPVSKESSESKPGTDEKKPG